MNKLLRAHPAGPTPSVQPSFPQCLPATENCEVDLQIGVFFDGTGNNQYWDDANECAPGLVPGTTQLMARKDSNVARLFRAYPEKFTEGKRAVYIPGVGTPFAEIGEVNYATFGPSSGQGGDGRINFGLLSVLDFIHRAISDNSFRYADEVILALCRNGKRIHFELTDAYSPLKGGVPDAQALDAVGMRTEGGLLCFGSGSREHAEAFYRREVQALADRIAKTAKPKLIRISLDVFGFSRGAAQARVFCNWLRALMDGDRLCGVRTEIRFVGLFDTVASIGIPASAGGDGHFSWATSDALAVPAHVQCVHYVAMHENRTSFPLDSIRSRDGSLASRHKEYAVPGMHSDVGGGYLPGSQGRGPSGRYDDMLSQIPLELMYDAARMAQVPLNKKLAEEGNYDPFAIHPDVRNAYDAFMQAVPAEATASQWLISYLAWRYQVRNVFSTKLAWVARAKKAFPHDFQDLEGANQTLLKDISALDGMTVEESEYLKRAAMVSPMVYGGDAVTKTSSRLVLADEARDVLEHIKKHPTLGTPENPEHLTPQAYLFANYLHDSYAGFRPLDQPLSRLGCADPVPGRWELQGYLRYRRIYRATGKPVTHAPPTEQQLAQPRTPFLTPAPATD